MNAPTRRGSAPALLVVVTGITSLAGCGDAGSCAEESMAAPARAQGIGDDGIGTSPSAIHAQAIGDDGIGTSPSAMNGSPESDPCSDDDVAGPELVARARGFNVEIKGVVDDAPVDPKN